MKDRMKDQPKPQFVSVGERSPEKGGKPIEQREAMGDTTFATCPTCNKHPLKVKTAKTGSVFVACTGFPECKTTMNLPKALESINMVEEFCKECQKRDKKQVKKFRLDFVTDFVNEAMTEVLPDDDNTSGVFCVIPNCDPAFKTLCDATYGLQNKRNYDTAFNKNNGGVPNYYKEKGGYSGTQGP